MRGQTLLVFVIVAVSLARSQMTKTKSGPPPPSRRRGDNPDIGLPSGADVPDGRRLAPPAAAPPVGATKTKSGPPPKAGGAPMMRVRGDNTDRGLPSGKDVPDGRRFMSKTKSGPPPPAGGAPKVVIAPPAGGAPPAFVAPPAYVAPKAGGPPPAVAGYMPPVKGDNTDRGLPSGKDVPDGRRFMTKTKSGPPPPSAGAAPAAGPPAAAPAYISKTKWGPPPPAAGAPPAYAAPPAYGAPPAYAAPPAYGAPPAGGAPQAGGAPPANGGDNTDVGLPSGKDVPDGQRFIPAAPAGPAAQAFNFPVFPMFPWFQPPVPSCASKCPYAWEPVCSKFGNTYDNDCRLQCSGEPYDCNGECPCNGPVDPIVQPVDTCASQCGWDEFNPVCSTDDQQYPNICSMNCDGAELQCSSHCPC